MTSLACGLRRARTPEAPPPLTPLLDVAERLLEQRDDVLVVEGVEALPAAALDRDERVLAEDAQLVGDRRLLHPEGSHEVDDGVGAVERHPRICTRLGVESANIVSASCCATRPSILRPDGLFCLTSTELSVIEYRRRTRLRERKHEL